MKPIAILLAASLLIIGLTAGAAKAPQPEKVFWGRAIHGVQAGLSLEDAETGIAQGQPITFKLLLRNVGKTSITFETEGYTETPFNWSALTQERTRRVSIGRTLNVNGISPSPLTITLAPGETQILVGPAPKFRLTSMGSSAHTEPVAIIKPGVYLVQAAPFLPSMTGKNSWLQKLVTGALPLKVLASPAASARP
jgi:hypothetical protein